MFWNLKLQNYQNYKGFGQPLGVYWLRWFFRPEEVFQVVESKL